MRRCHATPFCFFGVYSYATSFSQISSLKYKEEKTSACLIKSPDFGCKPLKARWIIMIVRLTFHGFRTKSEYFLET